MTTDFSNKVEILATLKVLYSDNESLSDFFEFNDIGIPLAYLCNESLCDITEDGKKYIAETFDILLATLGIEEDTGFDNINELLAKSITDI